MTTNLDYLAAKYAQAVIQDNKQAGELKPEEVDNLVTKALGVLQENGVYACGLYLLSRSQAKEQQIAATLRRQMLDLIADLSADWNWDQKPDAAQADAVLRYLSDQVCGDQRLERLLLTKETLEQMLIYARYGAKAWKAEPQPNGPGEQRGAGG